MKIVSRAKCVKKKLLKIIQVNVFFLFWLNLKMWELRLKNLYFGLLIDRLTISGPIKSLKSKYLTQTYKKTRPTT